MLKIITVYYSRKGENYWNGSIKNLTKGNTEIVAEFIQKAVGGDLFEVETVKQYAQDYYACIDEAQKELRDNARPAIKQTAPLNEYDVIFVGYPNWWGTMPMAMCTLLERYDLKGKKIVPFCTNEGSGMGSSERDLVKICKGANVMKGLPVHGAKRYGRKRKLPNGQKGTCEMNITEKAKAYHEKMFPGYKSKLSKTDPEFIERFDNFAFDEVVNSDDLDGKTRFTAILASLIGCQGIDEYRVMLPAALNFGVTPVEIKEIVYQAVAYLGIGRAFPFLIVTNEILTDCGIPLPLPVQATTTTENRLEKGEQAQIDIFGESMRGFANTGSPNTRHINKWLAENCFGDYYTRKGLDYRQREMITFCFLAAQGGCEPQLTSHAKANIRIGNDKAFLIKIVSQCLPYIGYPRSLNALRCIEEASKN